MRAFILRRVLLVSAQQGDVILIGSRHSAGTLRVQQFLSRNAFPFVNLDLDTDPSVQALLDRFHVTVEDIPVVICRGETWQKTRATSELAECLGHEPADRLQDRPRYHCHRRGSGGTGRRRLCRLRGDERPRARDQRARRTGGLELENRELPRLSHRHLGPGTGRTGTRAGAEVRRGSRDRQQCDPPALRAEAFRDRALRRAPRARPGHHHRERRASIGSSRYPTSSASTVSGFTTPPRTSRRSYARTRTS